MRYHLFAAIFINDEGNPFIVDCDPNKWYVERGEGGISVMIKEYYAGNEIELSVWEMSDTTLSDEQAIDQAILAKVKNYLDSSWLNDTVQS